MGDRNHGGPGFLTLHRSSMRLLLLPRRQLLLLGTITGLPGMLHLLVLLLLLLLLRLLLLVVAPKLQPQFDQVRLSELLGSEVGV